MDEADALEALSHILERITEDPYNISLHVDNVRIARDTGMEDQVESALDMVTAFWAAGDYVWLPLIESKISSSNMESRVDLQTISDLFEKAEQDYVCTWHCIALPAALLTSSQLSHFSRNIWSL